ERRLARSREPRQHDELVAREIEVEVLEVVRPRAADLDELLRHASCGAAARPIGGRATRNYTACVKCGAKRRRGDPADPGGGACGSRAVWRGALRAEPRPR